MLCLSDHMETFLATKVTKLPLFKASLLGSFLLFLREFDQLHAGSSDLDRVLNRIASATSTLRGSSLSLRVSSLIGAYGGLQDQLICTLLLLFRLLLVASLR